MYLYWVCVIKNQYFITYTTFYVIKFEIRIITALNKHILQVDNLFD